MPVGGSFPYTYSWTGGSTSSSADKLCSGNNTITVTDANGCKSSQSFTINSTNSLVANVISTTNATCDSSNGNATVLASNGKGSYTYIGPNGNSTATSSDLSSGVYTVGVTDGAGCNTTVSVSINNDGGPIGETISSSNVSCAGKSDATAHVPIHRESRAILMLVVVLL